MGQSGRRVSIDSEALAQSFHGWGTSLAWFANHTGDWHNREELADLLFADPSQTTSLGLTIARYDIGGGDNPAHAGEMRPGAAIPSWRPDPTGGYDWAADPRQRWWLRAAASRAQGHFVADAISYSAPWWMTKSGRSNGYLDGTVDNLLPEREGAFAEYLADVVAHIAEKDGIRFRSLSPLNEPGTEYWTSATRQEGMRVSPGLPQRRLLDATFEALRARGLSTGLSAVDENGVDLSLAALRALDEAGFDWDRVEQINVHTYLPGDRAALHDLVVRTAGKRLQMSEVTIEGGSYAPHDIEPSLAWAEHLTMDLTQLRPSEYVYWQAMEAESETIAGNGNWGFIHYDDRGEQAYAVTKKFHAMRQYSNFIRPGARFLETPVPEAVASIDADNRHLTIVIYTDAAEAEPVDVDLSSFIDLGATAGAYRTSLTENVAYIGETTLRDGHLVATLAPKSITTFVLKASVPAVATPREPVPAGRVAAKPVG